MKMKAPEGVTDISVAGANYRTDEKGLVEVDEAHASHLFQFGFVDARPETQPPPAPLTTESSESAPAKPRKKK